MRVKGWTDGRYRAFIFSAIRGGMRRYPPKFKCLEEACVGRKINKASGRKAKHYKCASCGNEFTQKEVQVDHKKPVVDPKKGFVDWNTYIDRMFCSIKNFQVLCLNCHKIKTKREKKRRTS